MNNLLTKQRRWLAFTLLFELAAVAALFLCYYYVTPFDYYFHIAVALIAFFAVVDFAEALIFNLQYQKKKGRAEMKAAEIIGNDVNEAYNFGQIGLAVVDHNSTVLWVNDFLGQRFKNLVDKNIYDMFPGLMALTDPKYDKPSVKITLETHVYQVEFLKEARLFVFKDVTEFENIYIDNQKQSPVVGYLAIDNYSDVQMSMGDETRFADSLHDIREIITKFGERTNSLMRRIKDDRYIFITKKETYDKVYKSKFSIVDEVRKRFPGGFTISIGVAYGFPDYAKLADLASNALDVALSRGGDQTVIQPFSQPMIFLGGKTELQPSRNRVKIRTLSNSFLTVLRNYTNVIIMPHTTADFDAIGSALGVYLLCQYAGVPARIAWEDQLIEDKCRLAVESEYSKAEMDEIFASMRAMSSLIKPDTLVVAVDHSNPKISMFPTVVSKADHFAILDHHRPGQFVFEDPVFNGIDTSASSASELLTFYITYNQDEIAIDERTATFLLAGICLDTRFYKERTTTNTFEASALLKQHSADSAKVVDFLKEDLEEYRQKVSILNTIETPYYGCIVATASDNEIVSGVLLSQVANEGVTIRGMSASFCIGRIDEHQIKISCRSDGTVSVQLIAEKLGGGGRLAMSAATFMDSSVGEVKEKLLAVLKDYLSDAKLNKEVQE